MKCFKILFFVLLTFVIVSCSDDNEVAKSSENQILNFKIGELEKVNPTGDFEFLMPFDTEVTKLKPEIAVSEKATISPKSGQEQDFTNPVIYTVMAENGTTRQYKVSVVLGEAPDIEVEEVESSYIEQGKTITLRGTFAQQKDLNEVVLIKKTTESKAANYNSVKANSVKDTQGAISLEIVSLSEDFKTIIVRVPANTPQGEYTLQVSVGNKVTTYEKSITILDPNSSILESVEEGKEFLMGDDEVIEVVVKNLYPNEVFSEGVPLGYQVSYFSEEGDAEPYKTMGARIINRTETPGGNLIIILGIPIWNTTPGINYVRITGADSKQTNPIKVKLKENTFPVPEIYDMSQEGGYILVRGKDFINKSGLQSRFLISPESKSNLNWWQGYDKFYGQNYFVEAVDLTDESFKIALDRIPPFRSFNIGIYVNGKGSKASVPIDPVYHDRPVPKLGNAAAIFITAGQAYTEIEIPGENLHLLEEIGQIIYPGARITDFIRYCIYSKYDDADKLKFSLMGADYYEIIDNNDGTVVTKKIVFRYDRPRIIIPQNFPKGMYELRLEINNAYLTNPVDLLVQ